MSMIREAISYREKMVEYLEVINNSSSITAIIESGSIQDLRKEVQHLINSVTDYKTIQDIMNILYRESYTELIEKIMKKKGLDTKTMDEFSRYFFSVSGSPEDKNEFLESMLSDGIWDSSSILGASSLTSYTSSSVLIHQSEFTLKMLETLKYWKAPLGAKSGVGKGEGLIIMFAKDGGKAKKGDVEIGGVTVEVKANDKSGASGGRLIGTSNEWIKPPSVYSKMIEILRGALSPTLGMDLPEDPNFYNLTSTKLKGLNKFYSTLGKKKSADILNSVISLMYVHKPKLKWIESTLDRDGSITDAFLDRFAVFQFQYYQDIEKFDAILFMNNQTDNMIIVKDYKEYAKIISNGIIKYSGFSWKEDRNLAYQVGLTS